MAPIAAGSPFRRPRSRANVRSPSPPPLPPKTYIDLNSSVIRPSDVAAASDPQQPQTGQGPIRAYLSDIVVVGPENNETTALLSQLGDVVERPSAVPRKPQAPLTRTPSLTQTAEDASAGSATKQEEQEKRLRSLIEELVRTERSYVSRIKALKTAYADPLRHFAKSASTSIIPVYEAKTLFGNIDAVLPAALAFLADLEAMLESGQAEQIVGDVCLKHLKTLRTLDPYRTYIANQDEAQKAYQEMFKKHNRFVSFTESTKYQTTGIGNIGLRELLMEPVQRVPRYTLLWQSMAKCMSVFSTQRPKLQEATDIASRIARCEADEQTVRATVMYCLQRNVDGFPANLFSNNRNYLDSIDAEDMTTDGVIYNPRASRPMSIKSGKSSTVTSIGSLATSNGSFISPQKDIGGGMPPPLHCTLVLFDDKLMITKRQLSQISGRKATGLDDIADLIKTGGGVAVKEKDGSRKAKLSFRGIADILDVRVADMGNGDFQLYFEKPIVDQGERWSLPLRNFTVCHPPAPVGLDPQASRADKKRFVQNIWAAQALARTKLLPGQIKAVPYVLCSNDAFDVDGGRVKAYWNIWTSTGWAAEQRKAKVMIEVVGSDGGDDPLPTPTEPTALAIRLEPLAGELCRFSYASAKGDGVSRELIQSSAVNKALVDTVSKTLVYTLPSNNPNPMMQTPTLSKRASRMLFGSVGGSNTPSSRSFGDGYASSAGTHGRSRSITSRSALESGSVSGGDTLSSSSHSLAQPDSPRTPLSPSSPASPPWSGKSDLHTQMPSPVHNILDARLDEARHNSRTLAAMASPRSPPPQLQQAPTPSRVMAMRERVEARERQAKEDAQTRPFARSSSPIKAASPGFSKRVPVPTLASSIGPQMDGMSRDSSLSSLPQSPSRTTLVRGGTLRREGTLSPRGPRKPAGRGGYVAPLPPPVPTADPAGPGLGTSPLRLKSVTPSGWGSTTSSAGSPVDITEPVQADTAPTEPAEPMDEPAREEPAKEEPVVKRPLPIPQLPYQVAPQPQQPPAPQPIQSQEHQGAPQQPAVSRLIGLGAAPRLRSTSGRSSLNSHSSANDENAGMKRQHPAEYMAPRKRTPSDSVMSWREGGDSTPTQSHTHTPSGLGPSSSRSTSISGSGGGNRVITPRGALSPSRRVTSISSVTSVASATSVASTATAATVCTLSSAIDECDVVMSDHPDLASAADSARQTIGDARKQARSVRKNVAAFSKATKARRLERHGSLARSPHSRSIHAELLSAGDAPPDDTKTLSTLASTTEALEYQLGMALADTERVRMLARRATDQAETITSLEAQVMRARERESLLRTQLAAKDMEVDEIYNAFNAELDGMYNDATLATPDSREAALRKDLQDAKAARNQLALENQRLRDELAKEKLRREQMAGVLRAQGCGGEVEVSVAGHE